MAIHIYPVTKTDIVCEDYTVKLNGEVLPLNTARVSAYPFNRRWPGHQRQIEQSELVNFLSFAMDEPVTLEIIPAKPFEDVAVRPISAKLPYKITEDGSILLTLEKPQYCTVEPYGRSHALHIFADPAPAYDVDIRDENVLYYGPGEHEIGTLWLQSNQTLFIDEGAVVYGCVRAEDADHIRIIGRGILDHSCVHAQILFEANEVGNEAAVNNAVRTRPIQLKYCDDVEIEGITIRDSLAYNIHPVACRKVEMRNLKLIGNWRYNSDGIDLHNSEDVLIENCFIRTFDDSICVKGFDCYQKGDIDQAVYEAMHHKGYVYDCFRDITIRGCVIWNDWGKALEIGAETRAEEMYNITFEDCDVIHVTSVPLDCGNVDYADIHDVVYRNCRVELDDIIPEPILQRSDEDTYAQQNLDYMPSSIAVTVTYHFEYSAGGTRRGKCHDMLFEDIYIYGRHKPRFRFKGYDADHGVENVTLRNIYLNGEKLTDASGYTLETNEFCANIVIE